MHLFANNDVLSQQTLLAAVCLIAVQLKSAREGSSGNDKSKPFTPSYRLFFPHPLALYFRSSEGNPCIPASFADQQFRRRELILGLPV
jgi:hypothetical protein